MGATLPAISRWVEDDARRRVVARLLLRRQHRRRRARQPARRLLPAARVRHRRSRPTSRVALNVVVALHRAACSRGRTPYERRRRSTAPRARRRAGARGGLRRDRALGHDGARRRSDLDAAAVAALRRDGLHLLADPRGVPGRPRHRQQLGVGDRARRRASARRARLVPAAAVRARSRGRRTAHRVAAVLADQSRRSRRRRGSHFQLDLVRCLWVVLPARDPVGRELPAGARGGRRRAGRIRRGWSAASMPRTRSARSSARWSPAWCSSPWIGSSARAAGADHRRRRCPALLDARAAGAGAARSGKPRLQLAGTVVLVVGDGRRRAARAQRARRCRASWSPTAATRRRASARPTSSTSAKA